MTTLHIVNKDVSKLSPSFETLVTICNAQDAVLLIGDGVYFLRKETEFINKLNHITNIYLLKQDADARGLSNIHNFNEVDYKGFVELAAKHDKTMNW